MKKNKYIIILIIFVVSTIFLFKKISNNAYKSYDLALEAALNSKFKYSKEEKDKSVKILEKKFENKFISFFKIETSNQNNKLIDEIFIIEIDKKNNKYFIKLTPNISLDYDGETDAPYSLSEGIIKINENKNLYYGIGKILNKSYKLITENKNYTDINMIEDNIFIITDEKKYQEIQFKK
ncbi:hypothetical protein [Clostridium cochlearium]|uniref:Uncharacterized protein n=1 Tax=Clostridium cochlearium TaxID=1494 RepID=A0A2X2WC21_CLOCO|nr:hypothetical protein [Clostridium cochlearium]SQB33595.1 Uncharacterised protein [Clostridium cochlearium]